MTILRLSLFLVILVQGSAFADDRIVNANLHSKVLNEDRNVIVHLPRNYQDTTQRYHVTYVLDGTSQDQHTADKIDVLSDAGLIPKAIVVGLPNTRGNRERDQTPPYMRTNVDDENSPYGAADKFLSFIEKELIPFIEGNYRTSSHRAICGNSRGGLLIILLKQYIRTMLLFLPRKGWSNGAGI